MPCGPQRDAHHGTSRVIRASIPSMRCLAALAVVLGTMPAHAQGLKGLGPPGGLKSTPALVGFETDVLRLINTLRERSQKPPLVAPPRLLGFVRQQAQRSVRGGDHVAEAQKQISRQGLAPYGYRLQFAYGPRPRDVLRQLQRNPAVAEVLVGDFTTVGVGAFEVPTQPPYYQVALLFIASPDPRAGQPGLSPAQTDPVMQQAEGPVRRCYDSARQDDPNLGGEILIALVIDGAGKVTQPRLLRRLGHLGFDTCVLDVVRKLQFPKPYKGKAVTLRHPLRLQPPQGERRLGRLTAAQISGTFRRGQLDFSQCYRTAAAKNPTLRGQLTVSLTVQKDGSVRDARITNDTLQHPNVRACVLQRVARLRFPPPQFAGEVDLTYPLSFAPSPK